MRKEESAIFVAMVYQESIFLKLNDVDTLHIRRIYREASGPPVLMLHGTIENGRVFYTEKNKGIGPYLAEQGFDVFVVDFRGRGKSTPHISKASTFGQSDTILEEFPVLLEHIKELKGDIPVHVVAHSWGGILMTAYLLRFPETNIGRMVFFACTRRARIKNFDKYFRLDFLWHIVGSFFVNVYGYLPAKKLKFGADDESALTFRQMNQWIKDDAWVDPFDGFNYLEAARSVKLPPILHLVGVGDTYLGNEHDLRLFMEELGDQQQELKVLGKKFGNALDYDHINILTSGKAVNDHFPLVKDWLNG